MRKTSNKGLCLSWDINLMMDFGKRWRCRNNKTNFHVTVVSKNITAAFEKYSVQSMYKRICHLSLLQLCRVTMKFLLLPWSKIYITSHHILWQWRNLYSVTASTSDVSSKYGHNFIQFYFIRLEMLMIFIFRIAILLVT